MNTEGILVGKDLVYASLLSLDSLPFFFFFLFLELIVIIFPPKKSIISNPPHGQMWKGGMSINHI